MALRFRRRVRLAPGVRLNISGSGVSISAGPRGASMTLGSSGVYNNVGLPGTGLYYRSRVDRPERGPQSRRSDSGAATGGYSVPIRLNLNNDGTVNFFGEDDRPLPPALVRMAREQMSSKIQAWLETQAARINSEIDDILGLHHSTPSPDQRYSPPPMPFTKQPEPAPAPLVLGFWGRIWPPRRRRLKAAHAAALKAHRRAVDEWERERAAHAREQARRAAVVERAMRGDLDSMDALLREVLERIQWPRETMIDFDLGDDATTLHVDVDLPTIEDMPTQEATLAARGVRLLIRERSDAKRRADYARHVHAVGLRVIGEAFAALPTVQGVTVSAYTQRIEPATGSEVDEYLYSARVARENWMALDFARLASVDPIAAFDLFETRRQMDRRFNFKPVAPFEPA